MPVSWSPDGKQVVYARYKAEKIPEPTSVWSKNPDFTLAATAALPAFDSTGRMALTSFGPDGTKLFIIKNGEPTKTILTRKDLILAPSWSPDGKQIVVGVGNFTAFLDFASGGRKPVDPVNGGAQVAILNEDGTGLRVLTSGTNNNAFASYSPDGNRIVYRTAGPEKQGLRIMNLADGNTTELTTEYDNFPVWSPRGDRIAFIRRIAGYFQIMTVHPDGTEITQLTHTRGNEAHLAWSPDGERLLFTSSRMGFKDECLYTGSPQPYGEIFAMRYNGTDVQQLTDNQWEEGGPAWQPAPSKQAIAQK
jgi:Tol biopolymer transport system component